MVKRRAPFALGAAGIVLLAACTQPAVLKPATPDNGAQTAPGVTMVSPRIPEATGGGPFPALPAGYRGLGGAFQDQGRLVVVAPDMKQPMQKHDLDVGLAHGIAAGHRSGKAAVSAADCQGVGDMPGSPIVVQGLTDPSDEVEVGIACAELRGHGAHWLMAQLITNGDGYLSQVTLQGDAGTPIVVYIDVNRFANQLIDELGG